MQQKNPLKKVACNICGELVSLFAYKSFNTLHLASLRESSITKEKKKLLKLSKKIVSIATKFPPNEIEDSEQYANMDCNVKLFFEVYNKMEYLTLKELRLLYDFCYILRRQGYFSVIKDNDAKEAINRYNQYSDNIYELIELKKVRKKTISRK